MIQPREFSKATKPREIFVYTCQRITNHFTQPGFKYRKSKNDMFRKDGDLESYVYFQPSIKLSSINFTVHIGILSQKLAKHEQNNFSGYLYGSPLGQLAGKANGIPLYNISTFSERERVIKEVTEQIEQTAIAFFQRFGDIGKLKAAIQAQGLFVNRKRDKYEERALIERLDKILMLSE